MGGIHYMLEPVVLRMTVPHIPATATRTSLRKSRTKQYRRLPHRRSPGHAQPGQRRHHPQGPGAHRRIRAALKKFTVARLMEICAKAGAQFLEGTLARWAGRDAIARQYLERFPPAAACRMSWCAATWPKSTPP
jgi:hypothetical protein